MSNNGPKFRPIEFYNPPPEYSNPPPDYSNEGVYAPEDEEWYSKPQDEIPEMDMEAYAEANYHFTLVAFEALLHKHGLVKLMTDMSRDSVATILKDSKFILKL